MKKDQPETNPKANQKASLKVNLLVLLLCAALLVCVLIIARLQSRAPETLPEALTAAEGYVYINAAGQGKWFELPQQETTLTLRRTKADGKVVENVVALTPEGVYMQSSTCGNQDCVKQGLVTLENRDQRALQNMVLCLPNNVTVELYSAQELAALQAAQE